jgi:CheY-like chemotaxis protein
MVLAWLRSQPEFDELPVMLFTSSTQSADVEFSRRHRASAYVVKPANAEHLAGLIERIITAARDGRLAVPENQL